MNESVKLKKTSQLGASTVFVIIPFSVNKQTVVDFSRADFEEWYEFGQDASYAHNRHVHLTEPVSKSLLRQLLDKDWEIYSKEYIQKNPFTRGLICHTEYAAESLSCVGLRILVTYHSDGIGTVVLINSLPSLNMITYFQVIRELKEWQLQKINGTAYTTLAEYLQSLFCNRAKTKKSRVPVTWGEEYQFFSLGGADLKIGKLQQFLETNKAFIYGLTHQDYNYGGWERIRPEMLDTLLDRDLSRRVEYSLYLSDIAMLEVDGDSRWDFIVTWAKKKNTTVENMRIKLLFERVQLLELLLTQRFILQNIEADILQYEITIKTPVRHLLELKNKIVSALSDYYYANTMSRQHVSGIEWVSYGQRRLHLEELLEHINNRIELIESSQQIKNDFNNMRGNYIFQLISILLGSSAVVSIVDLLTQLPVFANSWLDGNALWIKVLIYVLFLTVIIILTVRYTKDR